VSAQGVKVADCLPIAATHSLFIHAIEVSLRSLTLALPRARIAEWRNESMT
jgi:hypothetical protein